MAMKDGKQRPLERQRTEDAAEISDRTCRPAAPTPRAATPDVRRTPLRCRCRMWTIYRAVEILRKDRRVCTREGNAVWNGATISDGGIGQARGPSAGAEGPCDAGG